MSWENWIARHPIKTEKGFNKEQYEEIFKLFIENHSGQREAVLKRQLFCYEMRKKGKFSFKEIGELIGKDHATVIYSVNKVRDYIETKDPLLTIAEKEFNQIKQRFL